MARTDKGLKVVSDDIDPSNLHEVIWEVLTCCEQFSGIGS